MAGPTTPSAPRAVSLVWNGGTLQTLPSINVGETVQFSSPQGKLAITFFSPFGDDTITLQDTDIRTFQKGGIYQFRCTVNGQPRVGGVVDVQPHP
jgi:hypothetical protein